MEDGADLRIKDAGWKGQDAGMTAEQLIAKARKIRMLLLDVDGVMTTGQVFLLPNGDEVKVFSILDGFGIVCAMKVGIKIGIISGRASPSLKQRCEELQIEDLFMDSMDKLPVLEKLSKKYNFPYETFAFIGDDVPDLPVLEKIGLSAAPQNAHDHVKSRVNMVLNKRGGEGAVREFVDFLLAAQEKEDLILRQFSTLSPNRP
jgi:3-deoxy-D-manno-octulosonate 8-phosphate phosphatase (KDO 8-P phosphatase)